MDSGQGHHAPNQDHAEDHSGQGMHRKAFFLSPHLTVLFKPFLIDNTLGMIVAVFVCAVLAMLYEEFKCLRLNIARKHGDRWHGVPCFSKAHVVQTILYIFEFVFGYMAMLAVMTFSVWIFLAVVLGSTIGFTLCSRLSDSHMSLMQRVMYCNATGATDIQEEQTQQLNVSKRGNEVNGNDKTFPKGDLLAGHNETTESITTSL